MKKQSEKLGYQSTWSCKLSCTLPDGIYGKSGVQLAVLSGRRAGRS